MSSFRRGRVLKADPWEEGVQRAILKMDDGATVPAMVLEEVCGGVDKGDEVIANTTAVDLGLGSGGYHFVLWNLSRTSLDTGGGGHIMKLRYTPLQLNVEAAEELLGSGEDPGGLSEALKGVPVIAGSLHSQLLPVAAAYRSRKRDGRLVYVMTDGGALPLKLSRTVSFLKKEGYLEATVTCGHAFGGDLEAVNLHGGLLAARRLCGADAIVAVMGPGIVGTGSELGFSGIEQGLVINAAGSLGGDPIAVARITFCDPRKRHRGLSHHTVSSLLYGACVRATLPIPVMESGKMEIVRSQVREHGIDRLHRVTEVEASEVLKIIAGCGHLPSVMGRSPQEDPEFFMAAGAAGFLSAEDGG